MMQKRQELYRNSIEAELDKLKTENFCKEYQFDKLGDEENFNERFNDPFIRQFLEWDRTQDFFYDIDRQILIQSNEVIMIYGPKGMGKSSILRKLMKYWQERFFVLKHAMVNKHGLINYIAFSDSQLRSIIRIAKEGDILGRDESPVAAGVGTRTDINALQNFINQTREYQTSSIFVNPEKINNLSGIDYYLEVAGKKGIYICPKCHKEYINLEKCPECRIPLELVYKKSKTRCIWYDRRGILMGFIYLALDDDEQFAEEYHKKKISNIKSTVLHGGEVHSHYDKERFMADLIKLYDFCTECGASSLADVKTLLANFNLQFDTLSDPEQIIAGSTNYIEDIVRNVFNALKGNLLGNPLKEYIQNSQEPNISEDEEDSLPLSYEEFDRLEQEQAKDMSLTKTEDLHIPPPLEFIDYVCSEDKLFELIKKNKRWHQPDRDIEIYRMNKDSTKSQTQIGKIFKIDFSTISCQVKKVQGALNEYKGKDFEAFVEKRLKKSRRFSKVLKQGNPGESDIFAYSKDDTELFIYSLKNLSINKSPFWLSLAELKPEIKDALFYEHDYKTNMILLIFDNYHNKVIQIVYDFHNPQHIELSKYIK